MSIPQCIIYFGIPRQTQSMIAYKILTVFFGNSSEKLHYGNVVNMPYCLVELQGYIFYVSIYNILLIILPWCFYGKATELSRFMAGSRLQGNLY